MIYRYKHLNKFTYDELINNYVYFSKPVDFNDPFEFRFVFEGEIICPIAYKAYIENNAGIMIKETDNSLYEKVKKVIGEAFYQKINELMNERGVCCFTKNHKDILMWSHYTNGHNGICIGYDKNKLPTNKLTQIVYCNLPSDVAIDSDGTIHIEKTYDKLLKTKAKCWDYEDEIRLYHKQGNHKFYLENNAILAIYFGLKVTLDDASTIARIVRLNNRNVKFYKMVMAKDNSYKLKEQPLEFKDIVYRDREEPHSSPLPHHAAYGSVLRDSADQASSDPGERKSK